MRKIAILLPKEWTRERSAAFLELIAPSVPLGMPIVLVGHEAACLNYPAVGLSAARQDPEIPLLLEPVNPSGRFTIDTAIKNKLTIRLAESKLPSPAELEGQALKYLYSHNQLFREIAHSILTLWCNKTPIFLYFSQPLKSPIDKNTILGLVSDRFSHRGPLTILESEKDLVSAFSTSPQPTLVLASERGTFPTLRSDIAGRCFELYVSGPEGYLCPVTLDGDALKIIRNDSRDPQISDHVFSRLTREGDSSSWYLMPYGYALIQTNGIGPSNSFGFRNSYEPGDELERRPPNHKVIAVFGGSAVHAVEVPPSQTMCSLLEQNLNQHSKNGLKVTVLNFGLGGHLVLNELFSFILFCDRLRPDAVIAHDGFNDMLVGMANDHHLINNYRMAYPPNFEQWAKMLQSSAETKLSQSFLDDEPMIAINSPRNVVTAYLERKTQFANVVRGLGIEFIWGLQPWAGSKPHSTNELIALENYHSSNVPYSELSRRLPFLYEQCINSMVVPAGVLNVDLISSFAAIESGADCFTDSVHLTANGNSLCASIYSDAIRQSSIWNRWITSNG